MSCLDNATKTVGEHRIRKARGCDRCQVCQDLDAFEAHRTRSGRRILGDARHNNDMLPDRIIALFKDHSPTIHVDTRERWDRWVKKKSQSFNWRKLRDVKEVISILDDYFFRGALIPSIRTRWDTPPPHNQEDNHGRCNCGANLKIQVDAPPSLVSDLDLIMKLRALDKLTKKHRRYRKRRITQTEALLEQRFAHLSTIGILSNMLRELVQATSYILGCHSCCAQRNVRLRSDADLRSRLCQAMEVEANRYLVGLEGTWQLR